MGIEHSRKPGPVVQMNLAIDNLCQAAEMTRVLRLGANPYFQGTRGLWQGSMVQA